MSSGDVGDAPVASDSERARQFAAGPPRLPRRVIWIALAAAAVLGIGGAFADHSFEVAPAASSTPAAHHAAHESQSMAQYLGARSLGSHPAPPLGLDAGDGAPVALGALAGEPVLLTFLGPTCAETCPVVARELAEAQVDLARRGESVHIVIANADPSHLAPASARAALETGPLAALRSATYLSGSLPALERVWKAYGVTIELAPTTGALAYTSVIFLIDGHGDLRYALTPFANESTSGPASLPAAQIARFAAGIASYVESMAR